MRHKCQICGEKFVLSQDLYKHERTKCVKIDVDEEDQRKTNADLNTSIIAEDQRKTNADLDTSINDATLSIALNRDDVAGKNDGFNSEPNEQDAARNIGFNFDARENDDGTDSEPDVQGNDTTPRTNSLIPNARKNGETNSESNKRVGSALRSAASCSASSTSRAKRNDVIESEPNKPVESALSSATSCSASATTSYPRKNNESKVNKQLNSSGPVTREAKENEKPGSEPNKQGISAACGETVTTDAKENEKPDSEPNKQVNSAASSNGATSSDAKPKKRINNANQLVPDAPRDASRKGLMTKNVEKSSFGGVDSVNTQSRKETAHDVRHEKRNAKKDKLKLKKD